jgi:natural product precursor
MKKKSFDKKLSLKKEVITNLQKQDLSKVKGGTDTEGNYISCYCEGLYSVETNCENTSIC